jgi:hypothetical protein
MKLIVLLTSRFPPGLWGIQLFRLSGAWATIREPDRSTSNPLAGFGFSQISVPESPHNGFKILTPIGVDSATPLELVCFQRSMLPAFGAFFLKTIIPHFPAYCRNFS